MSAPVYQPHYSASRALVIGINAYQNAPPLGYAVNDARAIARVLTSTFGFPESNVTCLLDDAATREAITTTFAGFVGDRTEPDERLLVFFAGHGDTRPGRRGDVGYLVPVDGDPANLASLIRWDELTRVADQVTAKHVLFIMDACYGGLAVTRAIPYGSMRFLKDMLKRYSRQVLSAGKADEVVADSGGPRPEHSIFTGHLLDGLEGAAASPDGVITANGLMAYVYNKVATDRYSRQSPHYGFLDGDGDFVFAAPDLHRAVPSTSTDSDILVPVPLSLAPALVSARMGIAEQIKEYLSEPRFRIRLDDLVSGEVKTALARLDSQGLTMGAPHPTSSEAAERVKVYEYCTDELLPLSLLLGRWADESQRHLLGVVISRFAERIPSPSGYQAWTGMAWFPVIRLFTAGGIACLLQADYKNLAALFLSRVATPAIADRASDHLVSTVAHGALHADRGDVFKLMPGHERQYTPRSEYLYKSLQPQVEDHFFVGRTYEALFDRFELLFALVVLDLRLARGEHIWAPLGRFGWKHRNSYESPFSAILQEAVHDGDNWPPLRAGLFGGSLTRFQTAAQQLEEMLGRLPW